jgi:uncharacterized protein
MSEQENIQRVKDGYAAFMRGDIPAILDTLTDDTVWVSPGPADLPSSGTFRGKQEVVAFFTSLGETSEFQVFDPREFIAQGDKVVVLIHTESTIRRNGRKVVDDTAHVWTFRDGKTSHLQFYLDTEAVAAAYRGH